MVHTNINPPMEKWMKEQAAKSHGGLCMSKFVQLSEQKRLTRLQTVRSTLVVQQGWNNNPRRNTKTSKSSISSSKQKNPMNAATRHVKEVTISFRDAVHSEQTRTGLTLRLHHPTIDEKEVQRISMKREHTSTRRATKSQSLPAYPCPADSISSHTSTKTVKKTNGKENDKRQFLHHKTNDATKSTSPPAPVKEEEEISSSDDDVPLATHTQTRPRRRRRKEPSVYVGADHVSISALTEEREEALALLKALGYDQDACIQQVDMNCKVSSPTTTTNTPTATPEDYYDTEDHEEYYSTSSSSNHDKDVDSSSDSISL